MARNGAAAPHLEADAVVVGSGLAGLLTALELQAMRVIVVTQGSLGDEASSAWAKTRPAPRPASSATGS